MSSSWEISFCSGLIFLIQNSPCIQKENPFSASIWESVKISSRVFYLVWHSSESLPRFGNEETSLISDLVVSFSPRHIAWCKFPVPTSHLIWDWQSNLCAFSERLPCFLMVLGTMVRKEKNKSWQAALKEWRELITLRKLVISPYLPFTPWHPTHQVVI